MTAHIDRRWRLTAPIGQAPDLPGQSVAPPAPDPDRLPLLLGLGGILLSILLWLALTTSERDQTARALAADAATLEQIVRAGLSERGSTLERTARRWRLSRERSRERFNLEASVNQQSYPAFKSIGWVGPDLIVRWVYPEAGNEAAIGLDNSREPRRRVALLQAARTGQQVVAGPVNLAQGGRGLLLFQPIGSAGGEPQGFIYAAVTSQLMLSRIVGNALPTHALRVNLNGEQIYEREPIQGTMRDALGPDRVLRLEFAGARFQVHMQAPRPPLLRPSIVVPLLGLLVSLLAAAAAWATTRNQVRLWHLRAAARESEDRFRTVFETAAVGVARVAFDGARFIEVNGALCDLLGYAREELLATPWPKLTHRDDIDLDLEPFRRMAAGEIETYTVEKRFIHKAGHLLWARLTLSLVRDASGHPDYEICIVEDISEQKRAAEALQSSEDRLRRVLDQLFAFVGIIELDGTLVEANRAPLEAAGIRIEDIRGKPFWDVHWWSYDAAVQAQLKDAVARAAKGETVRYDVPVRLAGDRHPIIDFQLAPLRDGEGQITHLVPSAIVVEERVRAQNELRELAETLERRIAERTRALEEANEELNAFAYTVSHDLRAPLRAMEGFARILLEDYAEAFDEQGRRYATRIVDAAGRMEALISDLLDYSRLSRAELQLGPVDLVPLLQRCVEETRAAHPEAQIEAAGDLPIVNGDPAVLRHMMSNLLGNGVKFVRAGEAPRVRVRAEPEGRRVRLWFEDNGIGIAPEHQQRIFNVFERLHGEESYPGTGVGLAIVRKGAERLGGAWGVVSEPGRGSAFWLELDSAERFHA